MATYNIKDDKSFRVNLLVSNFICPNIEIEDNLKNFENSRKKSSYRLNSNQSAYYSNKKISEESSYVMNR